MSGKFEPRGGDSVELGGKDRRGESDLETGQEYSVLMTLSLVLAIGHLMETK